MQNAARSLRGLLLLSGLMLVVHTLVPHVHGAHFLSSGETRVGSSEEGQNDWLAVLTDLVDAEMGEDHLEHFSPEKTVDFALVVTTFVPTLPPALFTERFLFQPTTAVLVDQAPAPCPKIKEIFLLQAVLRGPPRVA